VTISSYLFPGRNLPTCSLAYRGTSRELKVQFWDYYDYTILRCAEFNKRRAPINQMTYVLFNYYIKHKHLTDGQRAVERFT